MRKIIYRLQYRNIKLRFGSTEIAHVKHANAASVIFRGHVVNFFVIREDNTISRSKFIATNDDVK